MKQAQIGSVNAGPRKYFKKPISFSVMDINVDIRGKTVAQSFLYKTADSREQRTAQHSLVKRLNMRKNKSV